MKNIKYLGVVLFLSILIILLFFSFNKKINTSSYNQQHVNLNPTFTLQGFNICAWDKDWWHDDSLVDEALRFAVEEGANLIVLDWPVNFYDDGKIVPINSTASLHPYWNNIKKVVLKAKSKGFYVILKPHTTLSNSSENRNIWNTNLNSFQPSNFFSDYKSYLIQLAEFATQNSVDAICIGTEMNHLDWQFRDEWIDLISSVRTKFNGSLTYDALLNRWNYDVKDIDEVIFWDQLDFIGVSLYIPLTTNDDESVDTLKRAFFEDLGNWFEVDNVITYLKNISNRYDKQIMALEGGYPSVIGGLYLVNIDPSEDKYENYDLQSRGLDAYLSVLDENKEIWFKGISLWELTPHMISQNTLNSIYHKQGFSVYNKPAAEVVRKHYTKLLVK